MGRCATSLLIVLALCLVYAVDATAQVDVSAVSERQTASPGDFVTTVFEVTNLGNSTETFDLDLDLPSGLAPLAPPRSLTLDPDASERLFISLNVTRQAQAGEREVSLAAVARSDTSIRDAATVAIDVEARAALAIRPPASRQVLPGEAVAFSFEVINRGNVIDRAVLEVRSFRGFSVDVAPSSAELMPGEAVTADVRVAVPDGADAGRDRVTLTARSATLEAETSATVDLTVLPPSPREVSQDLSLSVPSVLRLRETTTDDDPFDATISASGDADFGEASTFSYRVAIDELLAVDTLRAQLKRPTYGVTLGDLTARLNELIDVEGRGARASFGTGPDSATGATVVSARDLDTDEVNFGVRAALQGGPWAASLAGRRQASPEESVTGVSLLRLPFSAPALRVAGALSRNPATVDSAFLVRAKTERLPFTFDGELLRAGPDFLGAVSDEARVELRPGVAFDDATVNAVFDWERDGLESSATQTSSVETRIGANARLDMEPLPVITGQIDYEIETSVAQVRFTDASVFTAEARASQTFGPLTIAAHALRKVTEDRTTNNRIARSQWRTEAELRLRSALLAARLGITTDVDLDTGAIDDRFLSALLRADWDFEGFNVGFGIERNQSESRFTGQVNGTFERLRLATDGTVVLDDDDPNRVRLNVRAGLDFTLPVPFIDVDGQVEGRAFVDANGNGTREADEEGVPDLRLTLDGVQARTNDDGFYRFPPVDPGTYELAIDALPATLGPSSSMPKPVSLAAGERRRVNIPLVPVASIRATVFNDADEDGTQDPKETGFGGIRIRAVGPDDATRTDRTSSSGTLTFGGLTPGTWRVVVATGTLPENVELTTGGETTVDVGPGEQAEVAFGAVERAPEVRFSPTADFTVRPSEPRVGETAEFDGSASFDPDGTIETFEWDLDGDGTVDATGERVETVYERAGTFEVTLTVTDDDGLTGSLTQTTEVTSR